MLRNATAVQSGVVRLLEDRDAPAVLRLLGRDPIGNVFVTSRVEAAGLEPSRLGAQVWGYDRGRELTALCYAGANLIPVGDDTEALTAFAWYAARQGRRCSSIVGPAEEVLALWELLEPTWGAPRELRAVQPVMASKSDTCATRIPGMSVSPFMDRYFLVVW